MSRYAQNTSVSVEKSKAEIESILSRYGASEFATGWDKSRAMIGFSINGRHVRFILPLPNRNDDEFLKHSRGYRTEDAAYRMWEQACRQRWRAMCLCIKAKLEAVEAVEAEITTFEEEFLAHIVLPNGNTVGQFMVPQIESAYETGEMPKLLPMN